MAPSCIKSLIVKELSQVGRDINKENDELNLSQEKEKLNLISGWLKQAKSLLP